MANKPCLGVAICPHCKYRNVVYWDGNSKELCINPSCRKWFRVKRQKLLDVDPLHKISQKNPPL